MKPAGVYRAIAAITAELSRSGIAKTSRNEQEGWAFRGIDDVYNALSPLLAKHKLCILPRIVDRDAQQRRHGTENLSHVALKVAFEFVSAADGSSHVVEIWGEGVDRGDKATNKALTAAYKYAAFQVFCIPVVGDFDGDAETIGRGTAPTSRVVLEPVQGWAQWVSDIIEMIDGCQTEEAVARLQTSYRGELHVLSSSDADNYKRIGKAIGARRQLFAGMSKPDSLPGSERPPRWQSSPGLSRKREPRPRALPSTPASNAAASD